MEIPDRGVRGCLQLPPEVVRGAYFHETDREGTDSPEVA